MKGLEHYLNSHRWLMVNVRFTEENPLPEDFTYYGKEDYVLDRGEAMNSEPLTEDEMELLRTGIRLLMRKGEEFEMKQCFYNAQVLALFTDIGLEYWEGFAHSWVGVPVHHAWVTLNGKVIDPTWRLDIWNEEDDVFTNRIYGTIPEGYAYFGTQIDHNAIETAWMMDELCWPVLANPHDGGVLMMEDRLNPIPDFSPTAD